MKILSTCSLFFLAVPFFYNCQNLSSNIHVPQGVEQAVISSIRTQAWADSVYAAMNINQRIAQLIMMAAYSNKGKEHQEQVARWVNENQIGGLIWMQGSPSRQWQFSQLLQKKSKIPLLYAMDAEWGLSMRLDSTVKYPRQMTLGALQNTRLIYEFGKRMAYECKRMGVHVSFSPVLDVNNNPKNPVIGNRSFSSDPQRVMACATAYMQGLQDNGVLATGKHFPGHGDTDTDSHTGLPVISYSRNRLDSLELVPFKALVKEGIGSLMIAHLNLPQLDNTPFIPSTLSRPIVTGILRNEWQYDGLLFTDALNMSGVRSHFKPGQIEVKALQAGNDVLLFSENPKLAIDCIREALENGTLSMPEFELHCKRVLKTKYRYIISKPNPDENDLVNDLNSAEAKDLNQTLFEQSLTLIKNEQGGLPMGIHEAKKILCISIGNDRNSAFYKKFKKYTNSQELTFTAEEWLRQKQTVLKHIKLNDRVVVLISKNITPPNRTQFWNSICELSILKPTAVVLLTSPYVLEGLKPINPIKTILLAYESGNEAQQASAEALMGGFKINGKLPVKAGLFDLNTGLDWDPLNSTSGEKKKSGTSKILNAIDSVAEAGIRRHAYPGCQVVILHRGKPVLVKSYGRTTYHSQSAEVNSSTLYDLASLTKVLSTALALMKLNSTGQFDYRNTIGSYLPKYSKKANLKIEDVLTHQAGFKSWIPFYKRFLDSSNTLNPRFFSRQSSAHFSRNVAENIFANKILHDTIMAIIEHSELGPKKYLYSDLGYYYLQEIIEHITGKSLDAVIEPIYKQMNLQLTYLPLQGFPKSQIAPTEQDDQFRKQLVHGYVHDPGAAINGGVSGHAGLFGNALDVATLMQMFMQKGVYQNQIILDSNVVKAFTRTPYFKGNRRALCFDKPETNNKKTSPVIESCSSESFGHSGFTGTFAWADPKSQLVYVFLSNRVYPDAENPSILRLKTRQKIHELAYQLIQSL